ncbi:ABC transporter ATP-binding protein [Streptomyces inusitatus]|uniref:ABC transporter ATP-binding protein n=1 Tax=Streptomyces inusitatus TaxID=68221 RepID=A0A918UVL7_9ACTN|nr:ABC transporter ATP-binding protein [Streptomyces inusitatus]GGZ38796.1 ABC transporter ATP-binding protein [Streptomyces inusitatus]
MSPTITDTGASAPAGRHEEDPPAKAAPAAPVPPADAPATLGALLRPVRGPLGVSAALAAVAAFAGVVPLICLVELAGVLLPGVSGGAVDEDAAWTAAGIAAGALALRLVLTLAAATVSHLADVRLGSSVRRSVVRRLGRVPLGWFTERNSGLVKKAVQDDVGALHHLVAHSVTELTTAVVVPVTILGYLLLTDPLMTAVTLLPVLAGMLGLRIATRGTTEKMVEYAGSLGRLGSVTVGFVDGITEVKSFGTIGRAHRSYREAADDFDSKHYEWMRSSSAGATFMELALSPMTLLLTTTAAGAALLNAGWLDGPLELLPFIVLGLAIPAPVLAVGFNYHALLAARGAADRVRQILAEPELSSVPHGPRLSRAGSTIRFESVDFSYGETSALRGIDLTLAPGTMTALVGPSGSGKSTLAKLLARFQDPAGGRITVDGTDLRRLPFADLYEHVGFVFQDTTPLRMSLRDNIRLARPDASDEDVLRAARAAHVAEVIERLPKGLDSVVGEDATLSGGECQRIAIARAILADRPVLILDEATSAVDPDSEASIQQALSALAADKTVLVVAHRLHTVRHADTIVVLDGGEIAASGTHEELLRGGGLYPALWAAHTGEPAAPAASEGETPSLPDPAGERETDHDDRGDRREGPAAS